MRRVLLFTVCSLFWLAAQAADTRIQRVPQKTPSSPAAVQPKTIPIPANPPAASAESASANQGVLKTPPCGYEMTQPMQQPNVMRAAPVTLKQATAVKASNMIGAIGDTVPIKGMLTIKNSGQPVHAHTLNFYVDGQSIGAAKTDGQGTAKVNYKVPNKMGQKSIKVAYGGSPSCMGSSDSANFGTIKSSTTLTLKKNMGKTPNAGGKFSMIGDLERITDKAGISGREVILYIAGKQVKKVLTGGGGQFYETVDVPANAKGTVEIKAQFEGDVLYAPTAGVLNQPVTGPAYTGYLNWGGVTGKVGQTVSVTAVLSKNPLFPATAGIGGKTVRIWRERDNRWAPPHYSQKNLGSAVTNSLGVAKISFKIDDDALPYSLYAHADDPEDRMKLEKKSDPQYKVERAPVNLSISGSSSASVNSTVKFKVKATRTTDGVKVPNATVSVNNGGSTKTDDNGEATVSYYVTASGGTGSRTLTFKIAETKRTSESTKARTLNVTPSTN